MLFAIACNGYDNGGENELVRYAITFNDANSTEHTNPTTFTKNDLPLNLLPATRDNYSFDGWFTQAQGGNRITQITELGNITLFARFSPALGTASEYTITYNLPLNASNNSGNLSIFTAINLPLTLLSASRYGYIFDGWFTQAQGGIQVTQITELGNITLYARFSEIPPNTYTITYSLPSNAANHEDNPATFTSEELPIILMPATRSGYTFDGWFDNAYFSGTAITQITEVGNASLFANFSLKVYDIIYHLPPNSQNHEHNPVTFTAEDLPVILYPATTSNIGYSFTGWFNAPDNGESVFTITETGHVSLWARFHLTSSITGKELGEFQQELEREFYSTEITSGTNYQMLKANRNVSWKVVIQFVNDDLATANVAAWHKEILEMFPNRKIEEIEFTKDGRNLIFRHTRVFSQADFPVIRIYGEEGQPRGGAMTDIDRDERHWVRVEFTGIECPEFREHFERTERMQIRGRGQSSWRMGVGTAPYSGKRPFRMRFATNNIQTVFDSNFAAREWTFIANQSDKTLMRNYSAYHLGRIMGVAFSPNARFVHVYMEGVYQGVYQMSDQLNQPQPGRVDITTHNDPARSEFLLQMCRHEEYRYLHHGGPRPHAFTGNMPFMVDAGGRDDDHVDFPLTAEYVEIFLNNVNNAINSRDMNWIERWIDIDSFINEYLVQELYKNIDVNTSSLRFTMRGLGTERRLHAGPLWDFDIAAGNAYYQGRRREGNAYVFDHGGYSPQGAWAAEVHPWFRELMLTPQFRNLVRERWAQIKDNEVQDMLEHVDHMAAFHANAFNRNFTRWQIMDIYVWPNPQDIAALRTHREHVDHLINWLCERRDFLTSWL